MAKRAVTTAPATADAALVEKFKDFGGIEVIERRLQHPDLPGTLPIRLNDEPTHVEDPYGKKRKWYLRWINGGAEGRTSQIVDGHGYVPVRITDLQNQQSTDGFSASPDGIVRRGDKGQEWLAKMPLELFTEIKRRQQDKINRRSRNAKMVKEDLANAAGRALGSEAGDFTHDDLDVTISRKRSNYGDELADEDSA